MVTERKETAETTAREAIIRFGGAFVLNETTNEGGEKIARVVFPSSRPMTAPPHDPYMIFPERNLSPGIDVGRLHHSLLSNQDAEPVIVLSLHGENQLWNRLPRLIEILPDGNAMAGGLHFDRSASLYDLKLSGIEAITSNRAAISAEVTIKGGTLRAFQETPNDWKLDDSGETFNFMDALEWRVPYSNYIDIVFADEGDGTDGRKTISLIPDKYSNEEPPTGTVTVALSCFPPWDAEHQEPHYSILETLIKAPGSGGHSHSGSAINWPEKAGARVPGTHCPNGYLKT